MKQVQKGIVRTDLDRDQSTGKYNLPETEICSQMRNIYYVVRKDYTNLDLQNITKGTNIFVKDCI